MKSSGRSSEFRSTGLALVAMTLVLGLLGCSDPPISPDPRAYEGSRAGYTLERSLSEYELALPRCALTDALFWDAPESDDWGRNVILRLEVSRVCADELLESLDVAEDDLIQSRQLPDWVGKNPDGTEPRTERVLEGGVLVPPTEDRADMQVRIAIDEGPPIVIHLRAIFP